MLQCIVFLVDLNKILSLNFDKMNFESQILFFFSGLGAFNALILSLYFLFFKKKNSQADIFLGALLLVLCIRTIKSVFLYFNRELFDFYIQLGLSACVLIGPFLYLYVKAGRSGSKIQTKNWLHQTVPPFLLISIIGFLYPYHDNFKLWSGFLVKAIYLQWLVYIVLTGSILRSILIKFWQKRNHINSNEIIMVNVFFGVFLIWLAYNTISFTSYIAGALTFSFVFYLMIVVWVSQKKKIVVKSEIREKYADKKIPETEGKSLLSDLEFLMSRNKPFKDPNLKLQDIAGELNVLPHYLSQFLNDNLGKSFSVFINEYRINEAKNLIEIEKNYTLEAIGYECGFNSKSTFFSTFKKFTGSTPATYKKHISSLPTS